MVKPLRWVRLLRRACWLLLVRGTGRAASSRPSTVDTERDTHTHISIVRIGAGGRQTARPAAPSVAADRPRTGLTPTRTRERQSYPTRESLRSLGSVRFICDHHLSR
eukprot:2183338-Prymnesium_polylepis.1